MTIAFGPTIAALTEAGFRAIAVDRLGYGRSSKPVIHYNLHMPARHTKALLDELGIEQVAVLGHSMGGMVATRFTSTYPDEVTHVIMSNQIGLTDNRHGRAWSDPQELVLFAGIGHVPAFEYPEPYHAEVIRFLLSDPDEPADQG